jgi:hypothetical protein
MRSCHLRIRPLCAVLLLAIPSEAASPFEERMAFADFLLLERRYPDAALEFERAAFHAETDALRDKALSKTFEAALAQNEPERTLQIARAWTARKPQSCWPSFYVERALYDMDNAQSVLRHGLPAACPPEILAADRYLKGLSFYRQRDWKQGASSFRDVPAESALGARAKAAADKSREGETIRWKSPGLAAGLNALLPGAGYAYAKRPQTAAAAFVVTGLFIAGTYGAAHKGEPALAALLGLFSFGWYFGGVSGSARAAERENQARLNRFLKPFELNSGIQ